MALTPENKPQIITHIEKSVTFTIFDVRWVPRSARFVVLGQYPRATGVMCVYQLNHGKLELLKEVEKKGVFKCGTFAASPLEERHIATGDYDGTLNIWNLERTDIPLYSVKAHASIINQIDGCGGMGIGQGAPELATAGRDGCVKIWDPRQEGVPVSSLEPAAGQTARDCWAVSFGNSFSDVERMVTAGYDNGDVKLFDLRMNKVVWETNVKNGVCFAEFDRKDIQMNKLLVTTLESKFRVFDMRTNHPEEGYAHVEETQHESTVWCGRFLPQNREIFISCYGNGAVNLYKYCNPSSRAVADREGRMRGVPGTLELLNSAVLSTQPINCFDWSVDREGLCCFGAFDQTVRVGIVTKTHLW